MRRPEEKFASPQVKLAAGRLAPVIRQARLARNMTQAAAAERAKMSALTWMKIERGDVSVSLGAWLSALECLGLLDNLGLEVKLPIQTAQDAARVRARPSSAKTNSYDF